MNVSELYNEYMEMTKKQLVEKKEITQQEVFNWLGDHVSLFNVASDAMLAVIRSVNNSCIRSVGEFRYIDRSAQLAGMESAMISIFTDIEFSNNDPFDSESNVVVEEYDKARRMLIVEYLELYHNTDVKHFLKLKECEEQMLLDTSSIGYLASVYLSRVSENIGVFAEILSSAIAKVDPAQIEEAKKVLQEMNDSVQKARDLHVIK